MTALPAIVPIILNNERRFMGAIGSCALGGCFVTQHGLIMGYDNDATAGSLQLEYDCATAARRRGIGRRGQRIARLGDAMGCYRPHGDLGGQTPYERLLAKTTASLSPGS